MIPIEEICANGIDDDCDGTADNVVDTDGDGYTRCDGDCCEDTSTCPASESVNASAIWDSGDEAWDSTVIVDNFQWIAGPGSITVGTSPPPN